MKTENNLIAQVTGTRRFYVEVKIPRTIRLSKDGNCFYEGLLKGKDTGLWNANLDLIKDQLPSQEDELEVVKEFINAGKIDDFRCNNLFSPELISWEEGN